MYKISIALDNDLIKAKNYLCYESKGLYMCAMEGESVLGAICFDIENNYAVIEHLKAEKDMHEPVLLSALNFLDLNGICDVYSKVCEDYFIDLGFKESDKYKLYINLDGYFNCSSCKRRGT